MQLSHLSPSSRVHVLYSAKNEMGLLTTLLRWNDLDPPSREEKLRNERVCKLYQHNRNPFVDHPEYASLIWGQVPPSRKGSYVHRAKYGLSNSTRTIKRDNWEVRLKRFLVKLPKKKTFLANYSLKYNISESQATILPEYTTWIYNLQAQIVLYFAWSCAGLVDLDPFWSNIYRSSYIISCKHMAYY